MKPVNPKISQDELKSILLYNEESGVFTWLRRRSNGIKVGDVAGYKHRNGYTLIGLKRRACPAHRLAWLYVYGEWPKHDIDHIDGCKSNNAIKNLRDVQRYVNSQNRRNPRSDNKSGYLGVCELRGRWQASIFANGRHIYLGLFDEKESARDAYLMAKKLLHEGYVCDGAKA